MISPFFDTVNHDKLMTIIGRTIKDGDVISIVRKYLVSGIMIDDEYEDSIVGTPQGGNLSPLLANIISSAVRIACCAHLFGLNP